MLIKVGVKGEEGEGGEVGGELMLGRREGGPAEYREL